MQILAGIDTFCSNDHIRLFATIPVQSLKVKVGSYVRQDSADVCTGNPNDWDKMLQVDLEAPMRLTHHLAPAMSQREGGGHIINISSVAGLEPMAGFAAYSAAKFGLTGFSKSTFEVRENTGNIP